MRDRELYRAARFRFPWFEAAVLATGAVACLVFLGGMAVWLMSHRMGPFPLWLQVTTTVCPAVMAACRVMLWFEEKDNHGWRTGGRS